MKQKIKSISWGVIVAAFFVGATLLLLTAIQARHPELTPDEVRWLEARAGSIRLAPLPDSPPIDFVDDDGFHRGLTSDYMHLIERQLGITFTVVRCESWQEINAKLKTREVDVVGSIQNTPARQDYLHFTEPYLSIPNIILTRKEMPGRLSIETIGHLRIAIVNRSATHDYLAALHPEYHFVPVKDAASGFQMLSFGEVDAMVADQGVASYYMSQLGIANLRVAGDINYPWKLCLASRKDWPILNRILDKALTNISRSQRYAIQRKWIRLSDTMIIQRDSYLRVIGGILLLTLVASGGVVFWNRLLRRQVARRTMELGQAQQSRELATHALDASEERFRILVESSNDMIWEMDRFGNYTYVSPRVRDILGYEPHQLIGQNALNLLVPSDAAKNLEKLRRATEDSIIDCDTNIHLHRDGHRVILEVNGMAFEDEAGQLAGFRGVSRNITDRVEANAALKASEERFRTLVETTSDWIWEVDTAGRFSYVSPQALNILGYSPAELGGRRFMDLMIPADAARVDKIFAETVGNGDMIDALVNTNLHKSGRHVVMETSAAPFYDDAFNIQGYRGISRDITDRTVAEEELRQLRALLANIVDSMPSILVGVDRTGSVTQWNREAEQATGVSRNDALGQPLPELFPQLAPHMKKVERAIVDHQPQTEQRTLFQQHGQTHYTDVTVYPLLDHDTEGAVIRVDDVTNRIRLEKMMVQSEKMLSVGGLAAGMAHEINNPLAGILQNMQVMHNRLTDPSEQNQNAAREAGTTFESIQAYMQQRGLMTMMESVTDAGERAAKIVDNMLSFSRKDSALYDPTKLAEILERSIELAANDYNLKKRFDFRHIRIEREYDDSVGPVPCEQNQMQQVILNLLSNSAHAMAMQEVRAETPTIAIRLKKEANMALIEIEDNGPGMDEKTRKRVFEPFFTTKEVGSGTGLGLSVSYFIITENHGGSMQVESEPGKGTRFSIRLPFTRNPRNDKTEAMNLK